MNKKKVAFWAVIFLVNAAVGIVSIRTYQDMNNRVVALEWYRDNWTQYHALYPLSSFNERIAALEMYRDNWDQYQARYPLSSFNERIVLLKVAHEKTVAKLLKILGVDGQYDFNNTLVNKENLKKFFDNQVYVKTNLRLEVPEGIRNKNPNAPKEIQRGGESPAIVVGKYVLMTSHTNEAEFFNKEVTRFQMPQGFIEMSFEFTVLEHMVTILAPNGKEITLKEIYRNREKDFSLFEMPVPLRALDFPFKIGESAQLKIGEFIYMNGRPSLATEVARPGYVTSLFGASLNSEEKKVKRDYNEFGISQSTEQGDSGSPIIAFRDGQPELVGFYLGWVGGYQDNGKNTRSRALKINVAVDEIKKSAGIDLRELQRKLLAR